MNNLPPSTRKTGASAPVNCSAIVTRYPTGCFGIAYNGSMFHWWGFAEADVHTELEKIKPSRTKWEERYFDCRYPFHDPRSYRTRKFRPQNAIAQTPPDSDTKNHE